MPGVNPKERPKWLKWVALIVLILPVFPILAYRISKMVHAQDSDDPEELVQEIKKVNQIGKLFRGEYPAMTIQYRARIAEQRALQNRLEEAQREFSKIREELKDKDSEKAKYVRRYCNFWLANIRGDGGQAQYEASCWLQGTGVAWGNSCDAFFSRRKLSCRDPRLHYLIALQVRRT